MTIDFAQFFRNVEDIWVLVAIYYFSCLSFSPSLCGNVNHSLLVVPFSLVKAEFVPFFLDVHREGDNWSTSVYLSFVGNLLNLLNLLLNFFLSLLLCCIRIIIVLITQSICNKWFIQNLLIVPIQKTNTSPCIQAFQTCEALLLSQCRREEISTFQKLQVHRVFLKCYIFFH